MIKVIRLLPGWGWVLALSALAYGVLSPGLKGGFLFDDYVNLTALGDYGGVRDWPTLALYLTSALGDPLGRPLSMLSFLLDARTWPADPRPFLQTNVLLHLLNGALLTRVLFQLGLERRLDRSHALFAAVLGANIWLLHPAFLSTTLYIVQREAMLSATFVLLGVLAWISGRQRMLEGNTRSGIVRLCLGAMGCTALAALCKANGLLLPLLLLVLEATALPAAEPRGNAKFLTARRVLLGVPVAVLALLMLFSLPRFIDQAAHDRPWSIAQRLLTEPRVLLDYVCVLLVPHPVSRGVFHDDFTPSSGLFAPASTWMCVVAVLSALLVAYRFRRRWPSLACGVLFFLAGHAMESTIVPLELYFEHRNYLPAMLLFWPLALALSSPGAPLAGVRLLAAPLILAGLAANTWQGAQLWGQPRQLALVWADRNPDSARAQAYAAQYESADGFYAAARRRLTAALDKQPQETQLAVNLVEAECLSGGVQPATIEKLEYAAERDNKAAALDFIWLSTAVRSAKEGRCHGLDLQTVSAILNAMRRNPQFAVAPGRVQDFDHIEGLVLLAHGDVDGARVAFDHALDALPRNAIVLQQAALLGQSGRPDLALGHLDEFFRKHPAAFSDVEGISVHSLHERLLQRLGYWRDEFSRMRRLLQEQQGAKSAAASSGQESTALLASTRQHPGACNRDRGVELRTITHVTRTCLPPRN